MSTTIKLKSPKQLPAALRRLGRGMDRGVITALRRTARFGATEAVKVSALAKPRPRATGTFERSWVVTHLPDGAALSNSARHSIFVELGRRPGKAPPVSAIVAWMKAKKLDRKIGRKLGRDSQGRFKSLSSKQLESVARLIARKIGRKGFKGRRILAKTMPPMVKQLQVELRKEIRKVFTRAAKP